MNEAHGRSAGPSSRYTVLAANVAKVAKNLQQRDIEPSERQLMTRAADLVGKIIEGSLFLENRDARGLSNARESLFTVDHAISALKGLTLDPEYSKQLTRIFEDYERDLRLLASGAKIAPIRLTSIRNFFAALGDLFYQDVADSAFTAPRTEPQRNG